MRYWNLTIAIGLIALSGSSWCAGTKRHIEPEGMKKATEACQCPNSGRCLTGEVVPADQDPIQGCGGNPSPNCSPCPTCKQTSATGAAKARTARYFEGTIDSGCLGLCDPPKTQADCGAERFPVTQMTLKFDVHNSDDDAIHFSVPLTEPLNKGDSFCVDISTISDIYDHITLLWKGSDTVESCRMDDQDKPHPCPDRRP
jgi:hypothetical protein